MNFRQEIKDNLIEYDLGDPKDKKTIEDFAIELAGRTFNQYCVDMGYFTKRASVHHTEQGKPYTLTEYLFVPEKIKELASVKSKFDALNGKSSDRSKKNPLRWLSKLLKI